MEAPKLLWLKEQSLQQHQQRDQQRDQQQQQQAPGQSCFDRARLFLDLADFLVYRSAGEDTRSVCTTTCKWTYEAHTAAGVTAVPTKIDPTSAASMRSTGVSGVEQGASPHDSDAAAGAHAIKRQRLNGVPDRSYSQMAAPVPDAPPSATSSASAARVPIMHPHQDVGWNASFWKQIGLV